MTLVAPVPTGATAFGLAKEATRGTAVNPTAFIPITSITSPNDMAHYTPDKGYRGSAVKTYNQVATQIWAEPSVGFDVFPDTIGYLLDMILGEMSTTGTSPGSGTTLASSASAGASTISVAANTGMTVAATIQIDTGALSECRTIASISGTGPYTITFSAGQTLRFAHASSVAVVPVSAPFITKSNVTNTQPFQPPSYTVTDYNGTETFQAAATLCSELAFKFTATGLLTATAKFIALQSATTTKPTPTYSADTVMAAWRGATTLNGTPISSMQDGELTFKRTVTAIPTVNGSQAPAAIFAGGDLEVTGKANLIYDQAATAYTPYVTNTAQPWEINFSFGSGASSRGIKFHGSQMLITAAPHTRSKTWVELPITLEDTANTTDVGHSGGYSPVQVTLTNAVVGY